MVFVYLEPNTSQTSAEKLFFDTLSKLLPKSTGPFIVKKFGSHTLTIEEKGVDNIITAAWPSTTWPPASSSLTKTKTDAPSFKLLSTSLHPYWLPIGPFQSS